MTSFRFANLCFLRWFSHYIHIVFSHAKWKVASVHSVQVTLVVWTGENLEKLTRVVWVVQQDSQALLEMDIQVTTRRGTILLIVNRSLLQNMSEYISLGKTLPTCHSPGRILWIRDRSWKETSLSWIPRSSECSRLSLSNSRLWSEESEVEATSDYRFNLWPFAEVDFSSSLIGESQTWP